MVRTGGHAPVDAHLQMAGGPVSAANPMFVASNTVRKALTMSCDTSAYADGDVLCEMQELDAVVRTDEATGWIIDVSVLDEDDQAGAMDVVFALSAISLGTENAAVSITDAHARDILGIVEIASGDWVDCINSQRASVEVKIPIAGLAADSIWIGIISRDTKTYTASGLRVYLGILQD